MNGTPIDELPNLGPKSSLWLHDVGIHTVEQLSAAGAVEAFIRVKHAGHNASLMLLWALEAGLRGVHFTKVPEQVKRELLADLAIADPSFRTRRGTR